MNRISRFLTMIAFCCAGWVQAQDVELTPFEKNGKYGYLSADGRLAIDTVYAYADAFYEGLALVEQDGNKYYINAKGEKVIGPVKWLSASNFSDGWAKIKADSVNSFYIDKTGQKVLDVPAGLYDAQLFSEGLAVVSVQEYTQVKAHRGKLDLMVYKFGYMNKKGEVVIPCLFYDADNFKNGMARVKAGGQYGIIDPTGKFIAKPVYDYIHPFSENLARVEQGKLTGYINTKGKLVIKCKYIFATDFSSGLAGVFLKTKIGYINPKGKVVIPEEFDYAEAFSEGYAAVMQGGKWGFIDSKGGKFVQPTLEEARGFSEGLAPIKKQNRWGFMDLKGRVVISPQFDAVSAFSNGIARVQYLDKMYYVNRQGKVMPPKPKN